MEKKINFSYNWNGKLNCDAFTTFRIHQPGKYIVGETYDIVCPKIDPFKATIIAIRFLTLDKVNEFISYIDTGYGIEDFKKVVKSMYKERAENHKYDFILLKKVKE